jgi:flagellar basal body L-ring protein FlgH
VDLVEFSFNDLIKLYPSESVQYDNETFYVHLTQEETQRFEGAVAVQLRVKFSNGNIPLSCKKTMRVNESLSKEVI